jgi:hypothetical protein
MTDDRAREDQLNEPLDPILAEAIRALPAEIAPERDLFGGVQGRIRRQAHRRRVTRWTLALAASLALLALAGWLLRSGAEESTPEIVASTPVPPANVITAANVVGHTAYSAPDQALAGIRQQLRAEIEAKQDRLPPATRALVFENLATIDRAIAEIESALAAEPANAALGRTYIQYREREIDLLRQANRVVARL